MQLIPGFSGSAPKPKVEAPPPPPTPIPEPDDELARQAKRKRAAELQGRSGRESTVLTDAAQTLGGG